MPPDMRFDDYGFGAGWTEQGGMLRSAHALRHDGRVWLVDPFESAGGEIARAVGDGEPAGVIQLLDRHNRDCSAIAERLGVPLLRLPRELPGTPFTPFSVIDRPKWREVGLWWPEQRALVVAEAVGTVKLLEVAGTGVSVHPLLRLASPSALRRYVDVEHLLPGHGEPMHRPDTGRRIQRALDRSRRELPGMVTRIPALVRAGRS